MADNLQIHKKHKRDFTRLLVMSIVLIVSGVLLVVPGFVFLVRLLNGGDETDFGLSFGLLLSGGSAVLAGIISLLLTVCMYACGRYCTYDALTTYRTRHEN